MEKAAPDGEVAVVRGDFDWSDVGSWQAVSELTDADADGNRGSGERVAIDTRGTFIHSEDRVVATIGVSNLVIVDTPDAVLVAHRDHLQRVKEVVGELKARGPRRVQAAQDRRPPVGHVHGPRGRPGLQDQAHRGEARRLAVAAAPPSSQRALGRAARDRARDVRRERVRLCHRGESTFIPVETMHRLENRGSDVLAIIEVACGDYIEEDDIVRFDDKYGRVPPDRRRGTTYARAPICVEQARRDCAAPASS